MRLSSESAVSSTSLVRPLYDKQQSALSMLEVIQDTLEDAKAEDITIIDLENKTSIGDTMIIASGRSNRHVGAIAEQLVRNLKKVGFGKAHVEGLSSCDWVLIDAGDVIVHVFRPEVREFYNLEKIWSSIHPEAMSATDPSAE